MGAEVNDMMLILASCEEFEDRLEQEESFL